MVQFLRKHRWSALQWCFLFLPFVLLSLFGLLFYSYGIFADEWDFVPIIQLYVDGTLTFSDLFSNRFFIGNDHHPFFPRLIMLGLAVLTDWNVAYELLVNYVLLLGTYLFFLAVLVAQKGAEVFKGKWKYGMAVLGAWILFSPIQWENILWGYQIALYVVAFCFAGVVYLLCSESKKLSFFWRFVLSVILTVVASYSFGNGLVVWGVGVVVLILRREKWRYPLAWCAAAAVTVFFYYYGYTREYAEAFGSPFFRHPFLFLRYVFTYLGASLLPFAPIAQFIGGLFVLLWGGAVVVLFKAGLLRSVALPWFAFTLFGFFSALITAVARFRFDYWQAVSSRYETISMFFLLGLVLLCIQAYRVLCKQYGEGGLLRRISLFIAVEWFFIAFCFSYVIGVFFMYFHEIAYNLALECAKVYLSSGDYSLCDGYLYPGDIREWVELVSSIGWAGL